MKTTALPFTLNFKPVYCFVDCSSRPLLSEREKINEDAFTGLFTDPTIELYTFIPIDAYGR